MSETGDRIPYAVVVLEPGFSQRFADHNGVFAYTSLAPGARRLVVRQVGFAPFDSTITITAATPPLRIQLQRIAVRLAEVTVVTDAECVHPGVPDSARDGALATVFAQLRENAARYLLLSEEYPFIYRVERRFADHRADGQVSSHADTLRSNSTTRWPYRPGAVVSPDPDNWRRGTQLVHLPVLTDLADSTFQNTHCFSFAGRDSVDGQWLLRVDFRPARRIRTPDVTGSAWLEPETYQVRRTLMSLTRVERAAPGVSGWVAVSTFRELVRNLIVLDRVSVVTTLDRGPIASRTEQQALIGVNFLRPLNAPIDTIHQSR